MSSLFLFVFYYVSYGLSFRLGKVGNRPEKGQGERVVLELTDHLGQGYGITTDNFFTSLQLANKLWDKNQTLCGTLRKQKTFIPKELLPTSSRKEHSSMFAFGKHCTLVSYAPKKGKAVILLSTEHEDDKVSNEETHYKPDIVLHYNSTKGAVDTTDQMSQKYTTQRKTLRWPMTLFYHIIDIAAINAYQIWILKNPNYKSGHLDARRKFLLQLGKDLAKENMVFRFRNNNGLKATTKENILKIMPELLSENTTPTRQVANQGRCFLCARSKDRKSRQLCVKCERFVCVQHSEKQICCITCKEEK